MKQIMVNINGQQFNPDIELIEKLLADNPGWGRYRLSIKLCELWSWHNANGQLKDMACRTLLLCLEKRDRLFYLYASVNQRMVIAIVNHLKYFIRLIRLMLI